MELIGSLIILLAAVAQVLSLRRREVHPHKLVASWVLLVGAALLTGGYATDSIIGIGLRLIGAFCFVIGAYLMGQYALLLGIARTIRRADPPVRETE